jgi:signal transduction histidine kinase
VEDSGARHGSVVVVDGDGRASHLITSGDTGCCRLSPNAAGGVLPTLLDSARPVRLIDLGPDPGLVAGPAHARPAPFLGLPVVVRGRVLGALVMVGDTGARPFGSTDQDKVFSQASQVGMALEHARLLGASGLGAEALEALRAVSGGGRCGSGRGRGVGRRAMGLAGAELAIVASAAPVPGTMAVQVAEGDRGPILLGRSFPAGGSCAGRALAAGRPVVTIAGDPLLAGLGAGPTVAVPLGTGRDCLGALVLARPAGGAPFVGDEAEMVRAFAAEAAAVLGTVQVRVDLTRLSVLEDSERIAMELHDGVVQTLFAVSLSLEALAGPGGRPADRERTQLLEAVATIRASIAELRMYIEGLHPPERPGAGRAGTLAADLVALVDSFRRSSAATITADVDRRAASLVGEGAPEFLQAAREALSNAVRHSRAGLVALSLRARPDDVVLEVADNGVGFDPDLVRRGRGLSNLRSRAHALGGALRVESAPGTGTTVRIVVPV